MQLTIAHRGLDKRQIECFRITVRDETLQEIWSQMAAYSAGGRARSRSADNGTSQDF